MMDKPFEAQKTYPNPEIVKLTLEGKESDYLVFTTYKTNTIPWHNDKDGQKVRDKQNEIKDCWYPSIIFYDLENMRIADQVYGAELFVSAEKDTIYYISNDFFQDFESKDKFEENIKSKGKDAYLKYGDFLFKRAIFGQEVPKEEQKDDVLQQVMKVETIKRRPLNFRDKPGFEITGAAKMMEAHLHGEVTDENPLGSHLTVIHDGIFSNTFKLESAKKANQDTVFKGFINKVTMSLKIKFEIEDGIAFKGSGQTLDKKSKKELKIRGYVENNYEETQWKGFYVQNGKA